VGETDFVRDAFVAAGGRLEFWKVAIKPGRPFVWGRRANQFLFGLPGNPVSAFVTFLMLVRPALLRWQGATETNLALYPGVLAEPLSNPGNRRHFLRVRVEPDGRVFSAGVQASHALASLGSANGLLDLPPDATLAAGSPVKVSRWD
jgi:molybdopterin molybdotransferase